MALEIGTGICNQGKAGGVRFGKAVAAEALDLLEDAFGELQRVAALEHALDFLLQLPRPFNLNTYKMQYFPNYPFTEMALEAGHVKPEDVTYEAVAESVLYNMVFRPKIPAFELWR